MGCARYKQLLDQYGAALDRDWQDRAPLLDALLPKLDALWPKMTPRERDDAYRHTQVAY